MTTPTTYQFSSHRSDAVAAVASSAEGKGWCNVTPVVEEDIADLKVNYFGLWVNKGVAVASFVSAAPRKGVAQRSSLGLLHSRGRLGVERISSLLDGAPFVVKQDHSQRGLLLEVPNEASSQLIVDVMCHFTEELCDYTFSGEWLLAHFVAR